MHSESSLAALRLLMARFEERFHGVKLMLKWLELKRLFGRRIKSREGTEAFPNQLNCIHVDACIA